MVVGEVWCEVIMLCSESCWGVVFYGGFVGKGNEW